MPPRDQRENLPDRQPVVPSVENSPSTTSKSKALFELLLSVLDMICLFVSPFAILMFIVSMIILLDGFGSHVQFLNAIEHQGVEATGVWWGWDPGDKLVSVQLDQPGKGTDWAVVYIKYYSTETLTGLKKGQTVRLRYTTDPRELGKAVLLDHYDQVKRYAGYFTDMVWPLAISWLVVIVRPELLYLALIDFPKKPGGEAKQP